MNHKVNAGRLGGKARAESLTAERRSEIASKAANTRWSKEFDEALAEVKKFNKFDTDKFNGVESGFEDDDKGIFPEPCMHREHNPPGHLYIPPGKKYRHVCPACGMTFIMRCSSVRFTAKC